RPTRRSARRRSRTSETPRATRAPATRRAPRSPGRTTRRSAGSRRCPPRPRRPSAPAPSSCARSRRKAIDLPIEALPGGVEAVDDPVELGPAVGVGRPELLDRVELGDPGQTVLRGLGHLHLAGQEAPVAVARVDPEPFRRLLGEEPLLLVRGHAAEKEARGEADRARAGCDEMRQVTEAGEVAGPPFSRE